jgi:hypothetical protein
MINLDLGGNGDTHAITNDIAIEAIKILDNPYQQVDSIQSQFRIQ